MRSRRPEPPKIRRATSYKLSMEKISLTKILSFNWKRVLFYLIIFCLIHLLTKI